MEDPKKNTVGMKYWLWNGSMGSITVPAPSDNASLKPGKNIKRTIIPIKKSIGKSIADIASVWASPLGSAVTMNIPP